jgi:hypothetical protein
VKLRSMSEGQQDVTRTYFMKELMGRAGGRAGALRFRYQKSLFPSLRACPNRPKDFPNLLS